VQGVGVVVVVVDVVVGSPVVVEVVGSAVVVVVVFVPQSVSAISQSACPSAGGSAHGQ
jgi:hypothetical protein